MSLKHYCHNQLRFGAEFQCIARQLQGCIDNALSLYYCSHQLYPPVSLIFLLISMYCVYRVYRQHTWAPTARNSVICVNGKSTRVAGLLTRTPARNGIENEPLINVLRNPSGSEKVCFSLTPTINSESNFTSRD